MKKKVASHPLTIEQERAEFFALCDQWSDASRTRIEQAERALREQYGERGLYANEIDLSIERANRVTVVREVAPAINRGRSLRSLGVSNPSRLMAWALPRLIAAQSRRAMAERHCASDALLASLFAGLVEVEATTIKENVGVLVTPRDAVPSWEYLAVTPGKTRAIVTRRNSAQVVRSGSVSLAERLARVVEGVEYQNVVCVNEATYLRSLVDPGGYNSGGLDLARRSNAFLASHGESMRTGDDWNRTHMRTQSSPDRVAFRGEQRWVSGAPCRYQHGAKKVRGEDGKMRLVPNLSKVEQSDDGRFELRTSLYCSIHRNKVLRDGNGTARRDLSGKLVYQSCVCERTGWIGHRFVTFPPAARSVVKQAEQRNADRQQAETSTRKGPHTTSWALSTHNLARASKRVFRQALAIENVARKLAQGEVATFDNGQQVTLLGDCSVISRDRAFPVREWARRAALAGWTSVEVEVEVARLVEVEALVEVEG